MNIRPMTSDDLPALQEAIEKDAFHPGEWAVGHFTDPQVASSVIGDSQGSVIFVRFTKTLRISCAWTDPDDSGRNGRAVIAGLRNAVEQAVKSGYKEIIITTEHPPLAAFLKKFGFVQQGTEYLLQLT
jgi:hypothetical protein